MAWHAWHVEALRRSKKLPALKKMMTNNTSKSRQTWRQQLDVMTKWAAAHNAWLKRKQDGR